MASEEGDSHKSKREKCTLAKDALWSCLDSDGKPGSNSSEACADLRDAFEQSCSKTWMKYWDQRRLYLKEKSEKPQFVESKEKRKQD